MYIPTFKLGSSLVLFLQLQASVTYATTGLLVLPGVPQAMVPPDFGRSVKPIMIRGRGQIMPIKLLMPPPPRFSDPPTALDYCNYC